MIRITALMDNNPSEHKALVAEHGLSFLVESSAFRMLFDCGSGAHPWANAYRLGLDVGHVDAVALSHSHYDHAAGYRDLIEDGSSSNRNSPSTGSGGPIFPPVSLPPFCRKTT